MIKIYRDVTIRNSEISEGVVIGDDGFVSGSVLDRHVRIERRAMVFDSQVGAYSLVNYNTIVKKTHIGKFCSVSWNCSIGGGEHDLHRISTSEFPFIPQLGIVEESMEGAVRELPPTVIENDVWVAANCAVKQGIVLHTGAVVGMGAVVTDDIPPYEIWAGVPARKIGQRFPDDLIAELLASEWWNLPIEVLKENISYFRKPFSRSEFVEFCKKAGCRLSRGCDAEAK